MDTLGNCCHNTCCNCPDQEQFPHELHPEYRGKEYQACDLLTKYLTDNGFSVEKSVGGYETSFRAEWKHGEGGPVIGILCEYDALEGLGHGCGHHMQGPSCLGAAVALKECAGEEPFTLVVYGTPAEETLGSKCDMIKNGCFHELDAAFMMHGSPTTCQFGIFHKKLI